MTDHPNRRTLLAAGLALAPGAALAQGAVPPAVEEGQGRVEPAPPAGVPDTLRTERSVGPANARVTVMEFFSLTCGHCAAFHRETWPRVRSELIPQGRVRVVFRDFPLDRLALVAHIVARALPPERYDAFLTLLFAQQDRWAFARNVDNIAEIARIAAIAGLSREAFDAALADMDLQRWILEQRLAAEQQHRIASTPSFLFGSRLVAGNIPFNRFAELAREAGA
jgi:protein-disulfide isomerase